MEKLAFPTRDPPIDKTNLFLLSGRADSRGRHKSLQEKYVPTDRKSNFQVLVIWENKLSKAELYKSNFVKKITESSCLFIFKNSRYFIVNFFVIPVPFRYFIFCFKLYFPIADIIVNHLYIIFLRSRKTNTKCYNKKRKKSVARNMVAFEKYRFLILIQLDIVVLKNCAQM